MRERVALWISQMFLLPRSDWPDVMPYRIKEDCDLEITANFSLKLLLEINLEKLQSTRALMYMAFGF